MGLIDVSELMVDPDFVDPVVLIHRRPMIDQFGQNNLNETQFSTIGSVQPASGRTLLRLPDALRVANVSSFWIKGIIIADGTSQYPDVILFKGIRYTVQVVLDWQWGHEWCEGTAIRERISL